MLTQQLRGSMADSSGTLTVTAAPGFLAELIGLHDELKLRMNITTDITLMTEAQPEDVPPPAD